MQDRPDAPELAGAIGDFLRSEVLPQIDDPRLQFRLRVAINGVSMLEREAATGRGALARECELLSKHLGLPALSDPTPEAARLLNATFAQRLRQGACVAGTLELLLQLSELKLGVSSPATLARYAKENRS